MPVQVIGKLVFETAFGLELAALVVDVAERMLRDALHVGFHVLVRKVKLFL